MTLIVAYRDCENKIHIAADKAVNNGNISKNLIQPKFWGICGGFKIGISGDYQLCQALQYRAECPTMEVGEDPYDYVMRKLAPEYEKTLDELKLTPAENKTFFDGVIVHSSGRLFNVGGWLAISETNSNFVAAGSGADAAYPLWDALFNYYSDQNIKQCFRDLFYFISKHDQYVSEEFDYERVG